LGALSAPGRRHDDRRERGGGTRAGHLRHDVAVAERTEASSYETRRRRLTRMTNAHSKKREPLAAAVALHFMWYNFCRVHETLRVTPAMENGLAGHVWTVEELVVAALAEPVPAPPPPMPGEQLDMFIDRPSKAAAAKRTALRLIRGGKASAVEETEEESAPDTVRGTGWGLLEEGSEGVG
jgi:hypothetical protein